MLFPDVTVRCLRRLAAAGAVCFLVACGGGGGGGNATALSASGLPSSASLANRCNLADEQRFARSYLDEVYLWWNEVVDVPPAHYSTVPAYFDALRVRTRDRFSAVITSSAADSLLEGSAHPGQAAPLAPSTQSVPLVSMLTSSTGRRVGYLLFNDHRSGAQDALVTAFEALRTASVQELVLDLRYNSGGYLYVAQAAASMAAGPGQAGQVFEELRFSEKQAAAGARNVMRFASQVSVAERVYPAGHAWPRLSMPRVYVLATGMTCSASESIINGLRGVGIDVVIVGDVTCGKPYGFRRRDNCGLAYFAVEFQGFNAQGFGDYANGFQPQCRMDDDGVTALGSPSERLLGAALQHIDTGTCPAPRITARSLAADSLAAAAAGPTGLAGRLLLP